MLLHAHAVNEARTERGETTINSVWVWGGGHFPGTTTGGFRGIWSRDPLAVGLARSAGLAAARDDTSPGAWLASLTQLPRGSHQLLVLDHLLLASRHGDVAAWRENLLRLEREWFAPLYDAVRARRITRLTIAALGAERSHRFDVTPMGLLRVWRAGAALAAHAATRAA
jgi:hypothetical protein